MKKLVGYFDSQLVRYYPETIEMNAAGYVRVSGIQQIKGESLTTQRSMIQDYITTKSWELTNIYADEGVTGKKDDRPGLQAVLQAATQHAIDVVVVRDISRFGRSARDILNNVELLRKLKVNFISIKEGVDASTTMGRFFLNILASIAELEHEIITVRLRENRLARWQDKRIFMGTLPFGYTWNEKLKVIDIVPDEGKVYQRIVTEYLDFGLSLKDISIKLNDEHVPTRIRGRWSTGTLSNFLRSTCHYGLLTANTKYQDVDGKVLGDRSETEHIVYECEPLIPKSRWDQLQKRMDDAKLRSGRPSAVASEFLLYKLCRCGLCGGKLSMHYGNVRRDGTKPRHYACYWNLMTEKGRREKGHDKCTLPLIPAELLERHVYNLRLVAMTLGLHPERTYAPLTDAGALWDAKIEQAKENLSNLQVQLKRKESVKANLDRLLERDDFDPDIYVAKQKSNEREIRELRQSIMEAEFEIGRLNQSRQEEEAYTQFASKIDTIRDLHYKVVDLPFAEARRLLVGMLDGDIVVTPPEGNPPIDKDDDIMALNGWVNVSFRPNLAILQEVLKLDKGFSGRSPSASASSRGGGPG